jgi:PKD repeat protein
MILSFTDAPGVDFFWGPACEGQPVLFTVNPSVTNVGAAATWLWNFGDGSTSALMTPAHFFAALGQYTVTLTSTDTSGNANMASHIVTITQLPVSFFSYGTPNCSNQPVVLTDLSHTLYGYISQWVWNYGDGTPNDTIHFPDEPNVSHEFSVPGTSNVTLTVTNSFGCQALVTRPVTVTEAPIANFTYTNDCSGLATSFLDASSANGPGNTVQYWWDFGDPATGMSNHSDIKDPSHLFSGPGTYMVMHVVHNFYNCADTIVKPVIIRDPVAVDFVYDHTCVDGNANFNPDTAVMNVAEITSWAWDFGDGVTDFQQNTVHVYQGPGTYLVTLTVSDIWGCTVSKMRSVTVNPLPVAMFNTVQLPCQSIAAVFDDVSTTYAGYITNWKWDFGDGTIQSIDFPTNGDATHVFASAGNFLVTLTITSSDSCKAEHSQTIVVGAAPIANFE